MKENKQQRLNFVNELSELYNNLIKHGANQIIFDFNCDYNTAYIDFQYLDSEAISLLEIFLHVDFPVYSELFSLSEKNGKLQLRFSEKKEYIFK